MTFTAKRSVGLPCRAASKTTPVRDAIRFAKTKSETELKLSAKLGLACGSCCMSTEGISFHSKRSCSCRKVWISSWLTAGTSASKAPCILRSLCSSTAHWISMASLRFLGSDGGFTNTACGMAASMASCLRSSMSFVFGPGPNPGKKSCTIKTLAGSASALSTGMSWRAAAASRSSSKVQGTNTTNLSFAAICTSSGSNTGAIGGRCEGSLDLGAPIGGGATSDDEDAVATASAAVSGDCPSSSSAGFVVLLLPSAIDALAASVGAAAASEDAAVGSVTLLSGGATGGFCWLPLG
mmetsp:Transcript_76688/g.199329  ORF Transcript_76688/g.199329 Transcript_76688/m.199329 type:complete len:295 (+) Transcript_76688:254-1138(+)